MVEVGDTGFHTPGRHATRCTIDCASDAPLSAFGGVVCAETYSQGGENPGLGRCDIGENRHEVGQDAWIVNWLRSLDFLGQDSHSPVDVLGLGDQRPPRGGVWSGRPGRVAQLLRPQRVSRRIGRPRDAQSPAGSRYNKTCMAKFLDRSSDSRASDATLFGQFRLCR